MEENPRDIRPIEKALTGNKVYTLLHVVKQGVQAMACLSEEDKYSDAPRLDQALFFPLL